MFNSQAAVASKIIVALDVPNLEVAIATIHRLPQVQFWKVGLELFCASGPMILDVLKDQGKRIFLDLKLHDIPNTVAAAARAIAPYGVDFVTIHTATGLTGLKTAQAALGESATQLIGVTLLTSIGADTLQQELQIPLDPATYVECMANLAHQAGLAGIVCSPQEAARVKQRWGENFLRICPGIRPLGSATGDQARSLTPNAAFAAGASYLVIGRPILQAADPAAAFDDLCSSLV
ncbi:orotidine-5'-phosphate decarboxylase [Thermosynechococcus vestitus]|uniref:Orotidine 5'-phosphate decarboxylase n=1 Tax=Thermosynechococcus vestitus (strain NIES-2133 / IAM M-273 / BP-1) TaxID=197221 RepID=PYRF_THEVB|nr:orotidine-5'-phosphate decarboxylase [Thermosynechococcus vestitus]Q8DLT3.2 RecName: Full=Orotidine 5'-phosphate decarboxylase; AltName: Full=OMP decarboxylase; Short=OMPDCase; Short=OMPdecase [Thermosynechococcus vestitus BP-1]